MRPARSSLPAREELHEASSPGRFLFDPPLPKGSQVNAIRIGNTSQFAANGSFNAEILNVIPSLKLDRALVQMIVSIHLTIPSVYEGEAIIELEEGDREERNLLLPFCGNVAFTQMPGRIESIYLAPALARLVSEDADLVSISASVRVPDHQILPPANPFPLRFEKGQFVFERPHSMTIGEAIRVEFKGPRASDLACVPSNLASILTVQS